MNQTAAKEPTEIKAIKLPYNQDEHLTLIKKINPDYGTNYLIKQLESETWTLYNVELNETLVGIIIVRLEEQINKTNELVVLHAESVIQKAIAFIAIIESLLDDIAKQSKCKYVRIHSDNAKSNKLIEKHTQYEICQTIYRKEV